MDAVCQGTTKNVSDSLEMTNWVINTKLFPKCRRPIETAPMRSASMTMTMTARSRATTPPAMRTEEYMDQAEEKIADGAVAEKWYLIVTEDSIHARHPEDTAKIAEVLLIPPAGPCRRAPPPLQVEGRAPPGGVVLRRGPRPCRRRPACRTTAAPSPWRPTPALSRATSGSTSSTPRGYIDAVADDGARCLALWCSAAVVPELVDVAAASGDKKQYIRAVPAPVVRGGQRRPDQEVPGARLHLCRGVPRLRRRLCRRVLRRHDFCFRCGEAAHRPVSCDTVLAWLTKNVSDSSETTNWVLVDTKLFPKCRRPIEMNKVCTRKTYGASCGWRSACLAGLVISA
ncbi:hypothetical protein ACP4OV_007187 [Aristida adscensionis]